MKQLLLLIVSFMLILSACQSITNPPFSEIDNTISTPNELISDIPSDINDTNEEKALPSEAQIIANNEKEIPALLQIAPGIFDLGAALFSGQDAFVTMNALSNNRLLVENMLTDESVIYNYVTGEVSQHFSPTLRRLGMEHFYSNQQNGENSFTITLYDSELNIIAQHETTKSARPSVDGSTILYDEQQPIIYNTQTNEEIEITISGILPFSGYDGGIVYWDFDGQWIFFTANYAPVGTEQFSELWQKITGAYNVVTGEIVSSDNFPQLFEGMPVVFGNGNAFFWQCGCAFGTDGTYNVIVDAANSNIRVVDVGSTASRMSDNGKFLVSTTAENRDWEAFEHSQTTLTSIKIYSGDTLAPISDHQIDSNILIGVSAGHFGHGLSVSDSGEYAFVAGFFVDEDGNRRQTLFMVEMGSH